MSLLVSEKGKGSKPGFGIERNVFGRHVLKAGNEEGREKVLDFRLLDYRRFCGCGSGGGGSRFCGCGRSGFGLRIGFGFGFGFGLDV